MKNAMLVKLSIHKWTNSITDSDSVKVVAEKHGLAASDLRDSYYQQLVSESFVRPIEMAAGRLRKVHYRYTLPWLDDGVRILASSVFFAYRDEIDKLKAEFDAAVVGFIAQYATAKAEAKLRKKTLFKESMYPSEDSLRAMFSVDVNLMPVPEAEDFRVELPDEEIQRIKENVQRGQQEILASSSRHCLGRLQQLVKIYHDTLGSGSVFRDSLVENLIEGTELISKLNIACDMQVDMACKTVLSNLLYPPDTLRSSKTARNEAIKLSGEILDGLS